MNSNMKVRYTGEAVEEPPVAGLGLSQRARRTGEQPISGLIAAAVGNPDLVSFAAGLVDPATLPTEACARLATRVLADPARGRAALQYDTTAGARPLREACLDHITRLEGVRAGEMGLSADDIIITSGSQQMLFLLADVLLDPGDIVIAANPSYFVFTGTLQSLGARVLTVPMDAGGMDVEAVAALLERIEQAGELRRVKFIYCTSYYQNPTGLTLAAERRPRLLEIVRQFSRGHRLLIVEDAAYRELHYDQPPAGSIKSLDEENQYTVLTQTFSKPFAPGLRLGYTALPADLREPILRQKANHDFGSSSLCQQIALEALRDGSYQQQVGRVRDGYRAKRDAMLAALDRYMPRDAGVEWLRPAGGLYVWLTLPPEIDTSPAGTLFHDAVDAGVLYVPGSYCFQPDERGEIPPNHIRLSFGLVALEKIPAGIRRLADAVGRAVDASVLQERIA